MKRFLKLLARLYPAPWRSRYGVEFEALLEDRTPQARDAFDVFLGALKMQMTTWPFARITFACSAIGLIAALAISFAVPRHYISQTQILVGPGLDAAGRPVGTAAQDDIRGALIGMSQGALSSDSLASVIQKYDLYPRESARMPLDAVINYMRRDIAIRPFSSSSSSRTIEGFALYFSYSDPHVAQKVDAELVSRMLVANLRSSADSAAAGHPQPGMVFSVLNAASLPQKPTFPKRSLFGVGGLLAGLAAGLMLAAIIRSRRNRTAANG